MRKDLTTLLAAPAVLASIPALAQTPGDRPGFWHSGWDWGEGNMISGSIMMILFWGGLIVAIMFAARWLGGLPVQWAESQPPGRRGVDILQERFARGEIDKEEFEERKRLFSE